MVETGWLVRFPEAVREDYVNIRQGHGPPFKVKNNFNVDSFKGKKYIVVGTSSALGGNVAALCSAAYLGVAMCGIALLFLAKSQFVGARKLGDTAYLPACGGG